MANIIKQKRGTTDPAAGDLVVGELAINTTDGGVFTKTDGGTVVELGASINLDTSPQLGGDLASNGHNILVADDDILKFGADGDLEIYHQPFNSNSVISNNTNHLVIRNDSSNASHNVYIQSDNEVRITSVGGAETFAAFYDDAQAELYYDNVKKLETTTDGIAVTGDIAIGDDDRIKIGDGDDLQIYHNLANGDSTIAESGSGNLNISADNLVIFNSAATETKAKFVSNGAVALYYDNVKKFETASTGATVTGTCVATEFSGSGASLTGVVKTDATGISGASTVSNIVTISQADYDAISSPDASTIYYITS